MANSRWRSLSINEILKSFMTMRIALVGVILGLYLLLNSGFMQVRIPPIAGGGIPIGELILLIVLASLDYKNLIPQLSKAVFLLPILVWWGFGLGLGGGTPPVDLLNTV